MKKYLFLIAVCATLFTACDKIERPEVPEESNVLNGDTVVFQALTDPIQKLFLEEFTGHTCVNCPLGHKQAATMKTRYGDTLVLMSIHAGNFAEPTIAPYTADYRSEAGDILNSTFGVAGYPAGMINRTPFGGNIVMDKSAWPVAANAIDRSAPKLAVQIKIGDNTSNNSINVFVKTTFLQTIQKNIKLAIFITEDSIVSPQKNGSVSVGTVPDILDYVHRHMLRGAVNSVWGDAISSSASPTVANSSKIIGYRFSFNGKPYVKNHCSIIAVACDVDSKEVLQVEEIHLSHE